MFRSIRPRWIVPIVAGAVVVGLLLPTLLGGWAPLLHFTCTKGQNPESTVFAWVPALLVNSPYGGEGFGNGTVPPGPLSLPGVGTIYGTGEANGSAAWAGFRAEINVSSAQNQTVWGAGEDSRCSSSFYVSIRYWGGVVLGGFLLGNGNVTDSQEPTSLGHWTYAGDVNLTISNGFEGANMGSISTCGKASVSNVTGSSQFDVRIPVAIGDTRLSLPYTLPIEESFHYVFPPNFGTWQIDNLSAPGEPGGGWAFNYVGPCA
jgi:hypothetical protein